MVGPEGDGALAEAQNLARKLQVEVVFTRKLSKKEWIAIARDYNIFINTTNFDNMPVSVMEAMALGLPVISTNVGGMPFLINHGEDGLLVESNNLDAFVAAIQTLVANPNDVINLTKNARKKVEQFDWEVVKEQWFSLLR